MLPSLYKNIILQKENTVHLFKNTYTRFDDDGILYIGVEDFLLDETKLDL